MTSDADVAVPPLVQQEWPDLRELPPADFQIAGSVLHVAVYVRRVSGPDFHTLVAWLAALVVAPERRGQHLGSHLLRLVAHWMKDHDAIQFAALHCEEDLVPFFERSGFHRAPNLPGPGVSMICELQGHHWPDDREITYREPW